MLRKISALLVLLALLVVMFASSVAWGYVQVKTDSGFGLHWPREQMPLGWYLDDAAVPGISSDLVLNTLKKSFYTWEAVECSYLAFKYNGTVSLDVSKVGTMDYDRKNVMKWINESEWDNGWHDAFAVTVPLFDIKDGTIIDADILFNKNFDWSVSEAGESGKADLESIATHEIGHLFGLDHPGIPDATMFWAALEGETYKRTLAADDIAGVCSVYEIKGVTGSSCTTSNDCNEDLLCVSHEASGGLICSKPCKCIPDCSEAFHCIESQCLPPKPEVGGYGSSCSQTLPCGETDLICVSGLCTGFCDAVDDCPTGWDCVPLQSNPKKACFTDDPSLIATDNEVAVKIELFSTSPESRANVGDKVTINCRAEADLDGDLYYSFSYSEDGFDWTLLNDFSKMGLTYWHPESAGEFQLKVEVKHDALGECADAVQTIVFKVMENDSTTTDGDTEETGSGGDGGGCRKITEGSQIMFGFLLLMCLLAYRKKRFLIGGN